MAAFVMPIPIRSHLDDIKSTFIPEFVPEFGLKTDFYCGTNSGTNSGTYFFMSSKWRLTNKYGNC